MWRFLARLCAFALVFLATTAIADRDDAIFEPGDHCVAYRTVKDVLFAVDAEIIGRSCRVTASLVTAGSGSGPRIVVTVPVKSLKSGNFLRNRAVADLLGAKTQPDLRFTSNPI